MENGYGSGNGGYGGMENEMGTSGYGNGGMGEAMGVGMERCCKKKYVEGASNSDMNGYYVLAERAEWWKVPSYCRFLYAPSQLTLYLLFTCWL